ncbi:MAG: TlyA family RNA methyltransferase [Spirochaetales bacterium]|nr:TlyA family RNA methyltransferase [Spirochaetales bacterium]
MKEKKIPLLTLLCGRYPDIGREELYARIVCGEVYVNGEKVSDAKTSVTSCCTIEFLKKGFVSRGGRKLYHVLSKWRCEVNDKIFLDAGCSTGGFTDCLLKKGARLVYAIDVGYNQIDYRLRQDPRVVVMERTNITDVTAGNLTQRPSAAVCDLSFRSVRQAASHILSLVSPGWLIALIKPQFEWKHPAPGFKGIVMDNRLVYRICEHLIDDLYSEHVFVSRIERSPLKGRKGNTELFFMLKQKQEDGRETIKENLKKMCGV